MNILWTDQIKLEKGKKYTKNDLLEYFNIFG